MLSTFKEGLIQELLDAINAGEAGGEESQRLLLLAIAKTVLALLKLA